LIGFRFRKNDRRFAGKPDIVFPHYHTAIFVNGCFWHAHEHCVKFVLPKSNTEFWQKKLTRNKERDRKDYDVLLNDSWRVGVVW
jgi:DNA mismatch endonuclease, patch repair protein